MTRYARLCPPPWWRVVMRPVELRPPVLWRGRTSDFSGVERVISTKSATLEPRRPGVVGLYLRIPMSSQSFSADRATEDVDRALAEGDDRTLRVLAAAGAETGPTGLALPVRGVDRVHLDAEDLLDGNLDLGLFRPRVDEEGVLPLVEQAIALLGDDRREQDGARGLGDVGHFVSSLATEDAGPARNASSAPCVNTT